MQAITSTPFDVVVFADLNCEGGVIGTASTVVAAIAAEAAVALTCSDPDEMPTEPSPPAGCSFFGRG